MLQRSVVAAAAWFEMGVGAIFLSAPSAPSQLLFAAQTDGATMPLARFAGVGLLGLGIACLPSKDGPRRSAVLALLVFNLGVAILFAWLGTATTLRGVLLWPAMILHAVIATTLLLTGRSPGF
jgi:hypothetical protein